MIWRGLPCGSSAWLAGGGEEVLRASTLREMQRVQWVDPDWKTTWGLGFNIGRDGGRTFASHGGGCPGYYTHFRTEPKTKIAAIVLTNSIGSEVGFYTRKAFDLLAPAIKKALRRSEGRSAARPGSRPVRRHLWLHLGRIRHHPLGRRYWPNCRLIPVTRVKALTRLKKAGEHTFRRVREHDEGLGETILFELGDDGKAARFKQHSNWSVRTR